MIIFLIILILLITISILASIYFINLTLIRTKDAKHSPVNEEVLNTWKKYIPVITKAKEFLISQNHENLSLMSDDNILLKGMYFPSEKPSKKIVICVHGYTSCGLNDYSSIATFYHNLGYNTLLIDNRAHGESEGKYVGFGCLDRYDLKKWIAYIINEKLGQDCDIYLHGISMGASTVLMASSLDLPSNVKGIIADCGYTSAWDVFKHVLKRDYHMYPFPIMYLTNIYCKLFAKYGFRDVSTLDTVSKTNIPILFIHGDKDDFVPTWMSKKNYDVCASKKELLIIKDAGHAESYYRNTPLYEDTVKKFLDELEVN